MDEQVIRNMKKNASLRAWTPKLELLAQKYNRLGAMILDIGIAGDVYPGGNAYLFQDSNYETLDIDPQFNPTHVADVRALPFEDNTYDLIIFTCVIEHIVEDREKAIKECYRVVKPGGTVVIVAPAEGNPKNAKEEQPFSPVTEDEIIAALPGVSIRISEPEEFVLYTEIKK